MALTDAARPQLAPPPSARVAGTSNIGNYLAGLGIEATAGLGVTYRGLHATDERIRLASIPAIQAVYYHTVRTLLAGTAVDPRGGCGQAVHELPRTGVGQCVPTATPLRAAAQTTPR